MLTLERDEKTRVCACSRKEFAQGGAVLEGSNCPSTLVESIMPLPCSGSASDTTSGLARRLVLLVDQSVETREVLRTILERRGAQILETSQAREGLELLRTHRPTVTVLDLGAHDADNEEIRDGYADEPDTSLVVLGMAKRYKTQLPSARVVQKPYHFGPLIRTIEALLNESVGGRS